MADIGSDSDEFGLSSDSDSVLGLAFNEEGEAEGLQQEGDKIDLTEYGRSLGIDPEKDPDLMWLIKEAFGARLPSSWSEHTDPEGRVYFYNQVSHESSWSHPMDAIFRELIGIVKSTRAEIPEGSKVKRAARVQAHLEVVHGRATKALEGWSGPYVTEDGAYYYHTVQNLSSWDNPVDEWANELLLRQQVLHRCLLVDPPDPTQERGQRGGAKFEDELLSALPRLPLNLTRPNFDPASPPSPSSSRSFQTARSCRSACSARSVSGREQAPSPPTRLRRKASQSSVAGSRRESPSPFLSEEANVDLENKTTPRQVKELEEEVAVKPEQNPQDPVERPPKAKAPASEEGASAASTAAASAAEVQLLEEVPKEDKNVVACGDGTSTSSRPPSGAAASGSSLPAGQEEDAHAQLRRKLAARRQIVEGQTLGHHAPPPRSPRSPKSPRSPRIPGADGEDLEFTFGSTGATAFPKFSQPV